MRLPHRERTYMNAAFIAARYYNDIIITFAFRPYDGRPLLSANHCGSACKFRRPNRVVSSILRAWTEGVC